MTPPLSPRDLRVGGRVICCGRPAEGTHQIHGRRFAASLNGAGRSSGLRPPHREGLSRPQLKPHIPAPPTRFPATLVGCRNHRVSGRPKKAFPPRLRGQANGQAEIAAHGLSRAHHKPRRCALQLENRPSRASGRQKRPIKAGMSGFVSCFQLRALILMSYKKVEKA